jgi:hypothetical protein
MKMAHESIPDKREMAVCVDVLCESIWLAMVNRTVLVQVYGFSLGHDGKEYVGNSKSRFIGVC